MAECAKELDEVDEMTTDGPGMAKTKPNAVERVFRRQMVVRSRMAIEQFDWVLGKNPEGQYEATGALECVKTTVEAEQ